MKLELLPRKDCLGHVKVSRAHGEGAADAVLRAIDHCIDTQVCAYVRTGGRVGGWVGRQAGFVGVCGLGFWVRAVLCAHAVHSRFCDSGRPSIRAPNPAALGGRAHVRRPRRFSASHNM